MSDFSKRCVRPEVSIIVPLFNHLAETQAMLASLQATLRPGLSHEIILIDDGSTDGTRDWLATLDDPRIRVLLNEQNLGYARSSNKAVREARGRILALLNSDLVLTPGWLEPMLEVLRAPGLHAGLVGNVQYRVADGAVDHAGVHLNAFGKLEHLRVLPAGQNPYTKVLAVTGACILVDKTEFEEVGGFDERYFNGCEDIDLCFKFRALRKGIFVATDSRIWHHVSLSRDTKILHNERNSQHLFARWRSEIKHELGAVWLSLLRAGPAAYADLLSGQLAPDFVRTPHIASWLIAEVMLAREEYRWARDLDEADPNVEIVQRCVSRGLRYSPQHRGYELGKEAEFVVAGLHSARNFYVCGHRADEPMQGRIAITISVNDLQEQTFHLAANRNINVGIINPVLLHGISNWFKVKAIFVNEDGQPTGSAGKVIILTHIVIDDKVVTL